MIIVSRITQTIFVDLNVKIILKHIFTYKLSLLLIGSIVHIDYHANEHQEKYTICDISFDDEKYHVSNHQCQKCLNKIQSLNFKIKFDYLNDKKTIQYLNIKNIFYAPSIIFDLHSHPPPSSL